MGDYTNIIGFVISIEKLESELKKLKLKRGDKLILDSIIKDLRKFSAYNGIEWIDFDIEDVDEFIGSEHFRFINKMFKSRNNVLLVSTGKFVFSFSSMTYFKAWITNDNAKYASKYCFIEKPMGD